MVNREILSNLLTKDLETWLSDRSSAEFVDSLVCTYKVQAQLVDINRKANDSVNVPPALEEAGKDKIRALQQRMRDQADFPPDLIAYASHLIHGVLPPLEHVWDDVWQHCSFGPGTVYHARRPFERSVHHKIGGKQSVTPKALNLAIAVIGEFFPNWASQITSRDVSVVRGNRLGHVPKDVTKCRTIAIEPSLNMFLQKGVGEWLLRRLRVCGVADLRLGQSRHRNAVKHYNDWATIDLSDASDTISRKLVRALLPADWYQLLDTLRSPAFVTQGEWWPWESFSSQGNAFTFPLETLIFWAICKASGSPEVMVYGDDIIVPPSFAEGASRALEQCGFTVNSAKSFWGQHDDIRRFFRESCGEDTLFGQTVRSHFYKDSCKGDSDIVALMNGLFEKWGFLPLTHDYLGSLISKKFCGPRYFYSANDFSYGEFSVGRDFRKMPIKANGEASTHDSYLWYEISDRLGWSRPSGSYCPQLQTVVTVCKYWSTEVKSLHSRHIISYDVQKLAFLYSGEPSASPVCKPRVRTRVLTSGYAAES